jgi:hypothetical protein
MTMCVCIVRRWNCEYMPNTHVRTSAVFQFQNIGNAVFITVMILTMFKYSYLQLNSSFLFHVYLIVGLSH